MKCIKSRRILVVTLFLFLFSFVSADIPQLDVALADNLTILPDSDFVAVISIENLEFEDIELKIEVISSIFGIREVRGVFLTRENNDHIPFTLIGENEEGNYTVFWKISSGEQVVFEKEMSVEVTNSQRAMISSTRYYQDILEKVSYDYDNLYINDARKQIVVAEELSKRDMRFEGRKYLDLTREDIELGLKIEKTKKRSSIFSYIREYFVKVDWIIVLIYVGISIGLILSALIGKKIFKSIKLYRRKKKFIKKKTSVKKGVQDLGEPSDSKIKLDKELMKLRKRISHENSISVRKELLLDLRNCKQKYNLGLINLGNSYYKIIRNKLNRRGL